MSSGENDNADSYGDYTELSMAPTIDAQPAYDVFLLFKRSFKAELLVLKSLVVLISLACRDIVTLPLAVLAHKKSSSKQCKYVASVLYSVCCAVPLLMICDINFEYGLKFVEGCDLYSPSALYGLLLCFAAIVRRSNKHTHQLMAGSANAGKSMLLPTICHSVFNIFVLAFYSVIVGCYISGHKEDTGPCWKVLIPIHIIISQKIISDPPGFFEMLVINHFVCILAVLVSFLNGYDSYKFGTLVAPEILVALLQGVFMFKGKETDKHYTCFLEQSKAMWDQLHGADAPVYKKSIFVRFPHEAFALAFILIIVSATAPYQTYLIIGVVSFGLFAVVFSPSLRRDVYAAITNLSNTVPLLVFVVAVLISPVLYHTVQPLVASSVRVICFRIIARCRSWASLISE